MAFKFNFYLLLLNSYCFLAYGNEFPDDKALKFSSSDCLLKEPVYNNVFNFTGLQSDLAHTVRSQQGDVFEFNVCGGLSKECARMPNTAACLTRAGKQYILGVRQELMYNNGKMYFSLSNGAACRNGTYYTLNILLSCDYTTDKEPIRVVPYGEYDCTFYVIWETEYACLPEAENTKFNLCSAEDKKNGHVFDLMPLSDYNHRSNTGDGSHFIINVCKPVLYGKNSMCPPGSGVCFVNKDSKDIKTRFINYGTASNQTVVENGKLLLRHASETPCNATHNISSTIYFSCDLNGKFGQPDFVGLKGCNYEFSWQSSLACANFTPCFAVDARSGFEFDFSTFANETFHAEENGKVYNFGVCSNTGTSICLDSAGACLTTGTQSTTLGIYNNHLRFNETGTPYLLYENGSPCTSSNRHWSTKIEFTCSNETENRPKIIENSNCLLLIHFPTKLACQEQISCRIQGSADGDEIDLTPLISTNANYVARVNKSLEISNKNSVRYFLNVCRPLVSEFGLGCPGGSAACEAVMGPKTPEQEKSLGYPDVSLTLIDKSRVELKYLRGDVCASDTSTQYTSTVRFFCDPKSGKGTPILQSIIDHCHYQFDWLTNVICSSYLREVDVNTCEIINDQVNAKFNLRIAKFADNGKITVKANPSFDVDLCGPHRRVIMDYSRAVVKMFFNTKGPCGLDGSVNVVLRLACNNTEYHSSSSDDERCSLIINQNVPDICPLLGLPVPIKEHPTQTSTQKTPTTENTPVITSTLPSKSIPKKDSEKPEATTPKTGEFKETADKVTNITIIITSVFLVIIISILCLVILRNPVRRARFKNYFRSISPAVQYSRVANTEEASLLLVNAEQLSESDDELLQL